MSANTQVSNFNLRYLFLNIPCFFLCFGLHKMTIRPVFKGLRGRFMELSVLLLLTETKQFHYFSFASSIHVANFLLVCSLN